MDTFLGYLIGTFSTSILFSPTVYKSSTLVTCLAGLTAIALGLVAYNAKAAELRKIEKITSMDNGNNI